ncbi:MAG: hypothetical protein QW197_03485 [Candidatus Aenigmatarchaeota archaeon]
MNENNLKRINVLHKAYLLTKKVLDLAGVPGLFPFIWPYIEKYINKDYNYERVEEIFKEIKKILED